MDEQKSEDARSVGHYRHAPILPPSPDPDARFKYYKRRIKLQLGLIGVLGVLGLLGVVALNTFLLQLPWGASIFYDLVGGFLLAKAMKKSADKYIDATLAETDREDAREAAEICQTGEEQ